MTTVAEPEPAAEAREAPQAVKKGASRWVIPTTLIVVSIVWIVPTIGLFITSFKSRAASSQYGWWQVWQGGWTLDNYNQVLNSPSLPPPGFSDNFINTIIITIPATILPIAIAAVAAYAFAWLDFPFRNTIFIGVVVLLVVPLQVTWVPVLQLFNQFRNLTGIQITGTWWAIWLAHTGYGLAFAIFLLRNFMADIPKDLIESARIDGANDLKIFTSIILPLSLPAIAALAIFQFVWVWNDLMNALIFLQSPNKFPLTVGIRNLLGQYGNEWNLLAAGAFLSMIVPLIVFFALQRYFVRGVTAGAVKG
jgi:alpha-glucoside transport system permease protein